jgi:hypothetical protein
MEAFDGGRMPERSIDEDAQLGALSSVLLATESFKVQIAIDACSAPGNGSRAKFPTSAGQRSRARRFALELARQQSGKRVANDHDRIAP